MGSPMSNSKPKNHLFPAWGKVLVGRIMLAVVVGLSGATTVALLILIVLPEAWEDAREAQRERD